MATSSASLLMLVAMFVISAVAQSPASSPKAAASKPNVPSPSSSKTTPVVAPSPASVVGSPPSPTPSSATSPSPSNPPSSISTPPSDAPAPSENGAISNRYTVAGSVAVGLAAVVLIM